MAKAKAFGVGLDGYLYLQNRCRNERCGDHFSERMIEKLKKNFDNFKVRKPVPGYEELVGMYILWDGQLGGCNGPAKNSWEERRWTNWSAADMERMLDEQGIAWKPAPDQEYFNV